MEKNNRQCFTVVGPLDSTKYLLGFCLIEGIIDGDVGREGWVVGKVQPVGGSKR